MIEPYEFQETTIERSKVRFVDNIYAPEHFVEDASGFFLKNGVLHITFEAHKVDHTISPPPLTRIVAARIAMPIDGAIAMTLSLYDYLKRQGIDPLQHMSLPAEKCGYLPRSR